MQVHTCSLRSIYAYIKLDANHGRLRADELRTAAHAAFDAGAEERAEALWRRHIAAIPDIERGLARAAQQLELALKLDDRRTDVRARLQDALWRRAVMAEVAGRDELAVHDQLERLAFHDPIGEHMARWTAPAQLAVTSDPPGAHVTLERYVREGGRIRTEPLGAIGNTPLSAHSLAPGSYLLQFELPGKVPVRYPVALTRGEALAVRVELPPAAAVPNGFVFVPAGRFLYGSRDGEDLRKFLRSEPVHHVETGPYLIARDEVTYSEYLEFLAAQTPEQRAALVGAAAGPMRLEQRPEGGWRLRLTLGTRELELGSGTPLIYEGRKERALVAWERLPVTAISAEEATAYFTWLDRSGRLRGARYCDEHEWERAARGADGRSFASSEEIHAGDANFDETYGKLPSAYGPDPVGSYPQTTSPFGLHDTDGNAYELTVSPHVAGQVMVRGGAYFYSRIQARTTARFEYPSGLRDTTVGLRVCATWPPSTVEHE